MLYYVPMEQPSIPLSCRTCPHLLPVTEAIRNLESEQSSLSMMPELSEHYQTPEQVEARLIEIDEELESRQLELREMMVRTIGCSGVILSRAFLDERDRLSAARCGSVFEAS